MDGEAEHCPAAELLAESYPTVAESVQHHITISEMRPCRTSSLGRDGKV